MTLRFLAAQGTVSPAGRIHGGTILRWVDEAGQACASAWAGGQCVTSFMGGASFLHPITLGDLVEVKARLVYTDHTIMSIMLEVHSGPVDQKKFHIVTRCCAEYISLNADGSLRVVDAWTPETPGDMALAQSLRSHMTAAKAAL
jgi:acyl-CoA hydrolase